MVFEGVAQVFDGEDAAALAIAHGKIAAGDVVVIRYESPKVGPGMREKIKEERRRDPQLSPDKKVMERKCYLGRYAS